MKDNYVNEFGNILHHSKTTETTKKEIQVGYLTLQHCPEKKLLPIALIAQIILIQKHLTKIR